MLEFNKIKNILAEFTMSPLGRELVDNLEPNTEFVRIKGFLEETTEARTLLQLSKEIPLRGTRDIRNYIRKTELSGVLQPQELLEVSMTLGAARRTKSFLSEQERSCHNLRKLGEDLIPLKQLEDDINRCIGGNGEVLDSASLELATIRRQMQTYQNRIKDKLDEIMRSSSIQKLLQESLVTIRNDRYVIPVKQEYKGQFPGIVHDQSASGATLFIEPMAVVEANNQLRQLGLKEEIEIKRILGNLSGKIRIYTEEIKLNLICLGQIDFVFAKGRLSRSWSAVEPLLNDQGYLKIISGRHPLLGEEVVPIDVHLGKEFTTLVITGPNTGGKTVSLKTVGLFTLLAQSGLHVPAKHGTELTVFTQIFCDIGDEQSIEQSLSTFSSHMTNIVNIINKIDSRSLVLLDELGAGTDPTEGAALAMSILEHLHAKGVRTIATTHYSELKNFAYSNSGIENASVEFDAETLRPTYRLLIGLPGRSNAFYISSRLGLSTTIIERARSMMSEEELQLEKMIEDIQENQRKSFQEREEAEGLRVELSQMRQELDTERKNWEAKRDKQNQKAREEAQLIVRRAKREAEEIVRELKRVSQEAMEQERQVAIQQAKQKMQQLHSKIGEEGVRPRAKGDTPKHLKIGEMVLVYSLNQKGQVLSVPDSEGQVQVQVGILKINTKLTDLERVEEQGKSSGAEKGIGKILSDKTETISSELDLRGMSSDDALQDLEKYLDDAYLSGIQSVRVIHGKGTGVLRQSVQRYLQSHQQIDEYRLGRYGEGGDGVTVVRFKQK